jgi:hypothetical protein
MDLKKQLPPIKKEKTEFIPKNKYFKNVIETRDTFLNEKISE